jgi:chromosome segregation ATPase
MKNSEEYLFEVKTSNFKIVLSQLINGIETLELDDDSSETQEYVEKYVIVGKELIKQFDIIQSKLIDYQGSESPTKRKALEKQIVKTIKDSEDLENKYNDLSVLYEIKIDENKQINDRLGKVCENVYNLTDQIGFKNLQLQMITEERDELQNKQKEYFRESLEQLKTEDEDDVENPKADLELELDMNIDIGMDIAKSNHKSKKYMTALNKGNAKVIEQKIEKIKALEADILLLNKKLDERNTIITNLEKNVKILQESYDNLQKSYENCNKEDLSLKTELLLVDQKDEIERTKQELEKAYKEITDLKYSSENDLKKPLLEKKDTIFEPARDSERCNMCDIL